MPTLGLALSGGGFRATLFHLGMVRFMRDADVLKNVTHIASVSGGSIIAAHMVLNWDRYNGTPEEFDNVADELLTFIRHDVRNRIVRRLPLYIPARFLLGFTPFPWSNYLTQNRLIRTYYDRFLFADKCLHELPDRPELHVLVTNLSQGSMCSFTQKGMVVQRRRPDSHFALERVPARLATISMAVAASSAFPGFFPPVAMTAKELGAEEAEFQAQSFTDGGVYDNLGVRAFHLFLELWALKNSTLGKEDFLRCDDATRAFLRAAEAGEAGALRWFANKIDASMIGLLRDNLDAKVKAGAVDSLLSAVRSLLLHSTLAREEAFSQLSLRDPEASRLVRLCREQNAELPRDQHVWLNRHLLAAALEESVGRPCLVTHESKLGQILVSDAGKEFKVTADTRIGLLSQAFRSTDILWDRVWQLEKDHFRMDPAFLFVPITDIVEKHEDDTALHPTLQADVQNIRTDLDCFSDLEMSVLIRHGYCVGRKTCRKRPDVFGDNLPMNPPWDPTARGSQKPSTVAVGAKAATTGSSTRTVHAQPSKHVASHPHQDVLDARQLQKSAVRRTWSQILDLRDWPTYIYIPILILVLVVLPYLFWSMYRQARMDAMVLDAIAHGDPDFRKVLDLIDMNPARTWSAMDVSPADNLKYDPEGKLAGLELIEVSTILDLRNWHPSHRNKAYFHQRKRFRKTAAYKGDNHVTLQYPSPFSKFELRCGPKHLKPVLRKSTALVEVDGKQVNLVEAEVNIEKIAPGSYFDVELEAFIDEIEETLKSGDNESWVRYKSQVKTQTASFFLLFPESRQYEKYDLVRFDVANPAVMENVDTQYTIDHPYGLLIAWTVTNPEVNYIYECRWTWKK